MEDILFSPTMLEGILFLEYRTAILENFIKRWAQIHGISPERKEKEDTAYLESLNPTEWKDQDLYAILGIGHVRMRATDDDIRKAYRQRCLKHHPDKRMAAGQFIANPDGDYFACIVKAFEVLGVPSKRRAFDSVDHTFDDYIPSKNISSPTQFYEIYGYWFAYNSQWSNIEPVPLLGNEHSPREAVNEFYNFWYSFDSWREYSYLDEEEKEKGQDRDERRWIDKQNKVARAKLKKEEMARIRTVVDNAYALDPRIKLFKEEDIRKKQEYKEAKKNVYKQKQMEEDKARAEVERKAKAIKDQEENEAKEREIKAKKEKETMKKALKKERKNFRTLCKDNDYYAEDESSKLENMTHVEHLCDILALSDLEELNRKLSELKLEESKEIFNSQVEKLVEKIETEKVETTKPVIVKNGVVNDPIGKEDKSSRPGREWTVDEQKLLEQALKTYSAQDPDRWGRVASCLPGRSKKECMARYKELAALVKAKKAQSVNGINGKTKG